MEDKASNDLETMKLVSLKHNKYKEEVQTKQRLFWVICYWTISLVFMNYINILSVDLTPVKVKPLPDIGHEAIKDLPSVDVSVLVACSLFVCVVVHTYLEWEKFGKNQLRHLFFIHSLLLNLRTLIIVLTSLPVTQEETTCEKKHNLHSRFLLALAFTFSEPSWVSKCAGFSFSGKTTLIVIYTLHLLQHLLQRRLWQLLVLFWSTFGVICVIASKDTYTIGVILAIIFSSLLHFLFYTLLDLSYASEKYIPGGLRTVLLWLDYSEYEFYVSNKV